MAKAQLFWPVAELSNTVAGWGAKTQLFWPVAELKFPLEPALAILQKRIPGKEGWQDLLIKHALGNKTNIAFKTGRFVP